MKICLIDSKKMKPLKASQITAWLTKEGFLAEEETDDGSEEYYDPSELLGSVTYE